MNDSSLPVIETIALTFDSQEGKILIISSVSPENEKIIRISFFLDYQGRHDLLQLHSNKTTMCQCLIT